MALYKFVLYLYLYHASVAVTALAVYKLATLVHKCLTRRAPAYLAEYCRQAGTRRSGMQSAGTSMLDVPWTRTALCDRSFAIAGPRIWNSLPASIRDPTLSPGKFATLLKTCLFNGCGAGVFELVPEKCTI